MEVAAPGLAAASKSFVRHTPTEQRSVETWKMRGRRTCPRHDQRWWVGVARAWRVDGLKGWRAGAEAHVIANTP